MIGTGLRKGLLMGTNLTSGWQPAARFLGLMTLLGPLLAACATTPHHHGRSIFSSKEFGVPASRRVTNNPNPPHGGGIAMVGDTYVVHGQRYTPKANPVGYDVKGVASWYGWDFHGRLTANGEIFSANAITGGSPDLPLPCYARVINLDNGRTLMVRFNDRGPYMSGRVVDLSQKAATLLGYADTGTAHVRVQYVSAAPLEGDDTRFLMASLNQAAPAMGQGTTRLASVEMDQIRPRPTTGARTASNPEIKQVLASVNGLFSYAEAASGKVDPTSAHAAVDALAGSVPVPQPLSLRPDPSLAAINLDLGLYTDPSAARTAMEFAALGAVDEMDQTADGGDLATRLTLTRLKPGVERQDVLDLVHKLGLKDVVLY